MMLFAALFSMNTKGTPIVDHPHGFWIVFGIMAVIMLIMLRYFKKRDWL
jgi:Mg2+ and Co2+ transporter CorA